MVSARGQCFVELHVADDVAEIGLGQLGDRELEIRDVVEQPGRIGGLEEHHRVHRHHHVVLRDDLLRRNVDDLLAHVDQRELVDEGNQEPQTRVQGGVELAEALDDPPLVRAHDADAPRRDDEQHQRDDSKHDDTGHGVLLAQSRTAVTTRRVPSTRNTRIGVSTSIASIESLSARHSSRSTRTSPVSWVLPPGIRRRTTPSCPSQR